MTDDLHTSLTEFLRHDDMPRFLGPLVRLVAAGRPVELARIAEAGDIPVEQLRTWLRDQPGTDWDEQGRLVGFGLTQRETVHRFTVDARVLYTFCAADTLLFPPILGRPALVESPCAATGRPIRIEVGPDAVGATDPETAVVAQPALCGTADIRATFCDHGHFFVTSDAAREWQARHPGGDVRPVAEFFDIALATCRELGWASS
ncbi:organomercurial lyase MerB [Nocardia africana]|uniref:Alkylmercury lyase n=1 Tax=Nocardia africana TaxID=134964 RepID=A0A379X5E9_9NOCA|nr:organomercurial lyase MerB [Nocardia africana]MCC3318410.1 organomercurial lyase MerB [Nocardia africana]SUH71840.1 Alkylmercury lyase [Nocardia africana]